jgi:hypothetical protein
MPGQYLEVGHDHFVPSPFKLTKHDCSVTSFRVV